MVLLPDIPPAPIPAVIHIQPAGAGWQLTSSDGLFFGLFRDRGSALKHARSEAEIHPGHVVIVRETLSSRAGPPSRLAGGVGVP